MDYPRSMTPELHRQFENSLPYDMLQELKSMFEKQAGVERFYVIQTFHACKQKEGKSISSYVLKMKGYVEKLERLGNYNMHIMRRTIGKLHALVIEYEKGLPKEASTPQVLAIQGGRIQKPNTKPQAAKGKGKGKGKAKNKLVYVLKPKNPKPAAKEHPRKVDACHYYKEVGNWKRNCPIYLAELMKKKKNANTASTSVSKNDVLYFNVIPHDGIYKIDMLNLVPNVNSIYNVSNKKSKHNLDSTYLWHYRLAHISKKHIEKLQHDELLKSTDDECFDQCVSCLSGKMTRKPFLHHTERETDLLVLIHTDVCGPVRHVSRQGASYFISFTDDFSRYGYVYLLKHKHEVFKTFKVFKNEVENQIEKTIKALRSDRAGEYIKSATRILNMVPIKKVDKTPYELWYVKDTQMKQWVTTSTSYLKTKLLLQGFEPPQEDVAPARRSVRTHRASERLCIYVEVEEHRSKRLVGLSQSAYMDKILKRFKMNNSKRANIPMQERLDLNKSQGDSTPEETQFGKKWDKIATLHEDDHEMAYSTWRRRHNPLWTGRQRFNETKTAKLLNDILMFQQYQGESISEARTHYTAGGQLRKVSAEKAWNTIEELSQYEVEGWNDLIFPEKEALTMKTPT
ncbi:retrotransposon protein, putative, ty1-copia subclass [Tanacetum coccineum]